MDSGLKIQAADIILLVALILLIKASGYLLLFYGLTTDKWWAELAARVVEHGCFATGGVLGLVTVILFLLFGWSSFVFFFTLILMCMLLIEVAFALETVNVLQLAASYRFSVQSKSSPASSQD